MFWVVGLLVTYQSPEAKEALPPWIVSQTRVVPATRLPHPPGTPAAGQSSPPEMPPWKRSYGNTNDCVSPLHPPDTLLLQGAFGLVQLLTQRCKEPLLLPCQKR